MSHSFQHGLCYTFNSGKDHDAVRSVTTSGSSQSLSLILDAQPEEYYGPYSYEGTGFKIVIHDQKQSPSVENDAMDISPGFTTNLRVKRTEVRRADPMGHTRDSSPAYGIIFHRFKAELQTFFIAFILFGPFFFYVKSVTVQRKQKLLSVLEPSSSSTCKASYRENA